MSLCEFKPQPQLYFQGTHIQIGRWVSLIFRTISLFCRSFKCNWTNIIINKLTSLNLWQESFLGNNWKYENGESKSGCPSVWALNYLTLWVTVTQLWFPTFIWGISQGLQFKSHLLGFPGEISAECECFISIYGWA